MSTLKPFVLSAAFPYLLRTFREYRNGIMETSELICSYIKQYILTKIEKNENLNQVMQKLFHPFLTSAAFHIKTSHLICPAKPNDWFLYETQHWKEKGKLA